MRTSNCPLQSTSKNSPSPQSSSFEDKVTALAERVRSSRLSLERDSSAKRKGDEFFSALTNAFPKRQKVEHSPSARIDELAEECFRASFSLIKEKEEPVILPKIENEASCFLISDDQKTLGRESKFVFDDRENKMISENGDSYEGEIKGNRLHGYGRLIYHTGVSYEGGFQNGLFHGLGKFIFPNGDVYEAEFVRGVRSGNGTLTFADGRVYKGLFTGLYHDELVDIS